ncbi:hypothetical protein [Tenacibaculum sp. 190524A05c]|uniref:hypothetical protein n=1 Tax=Tenacibaculum platacis TaxID=3137852 RepID=UPI0031FBA07C
MDSIHSIVKKAQDDLFPELEAKIRAELNKKDKDWLIDQIIYLTCERHSLHEQRDKFNALKNRLNRIKAKNFNTKMLFDFIDNYKNIERVYLEESGFLINPSHLGLNSIESFQRTTLGEKLLEEAKDILYIALYGDPTINIDLKREREEILTIILPESKVDTFSFLKAMTETKVSGTWNDPEGISNDDQVSNIALQIEFSDDHKGTIGVAIFVALNLINLLEVNEQILYSRLEKLERSSLEPQ